MVLRRLFVAIAAIERAVLQKIEASSLFRDHYTGCPIFFRCCTIAGLCDNVSSSGLSKIALRVFFCQLKIINLSLSLNIIEPVKRDTLVT